MNKDKSKYWSQIKLRRHQCWSWGLATVGAMAFAFSAYFLVWHLFFLELPIEDIAFSNDCSKRENFRYDGVVYFDGMTLTKESNINLQWRSPWILSLTPEKELEIYVNRKSGPTGKDNKKIGTLYINQFVGKKIRERSNLPIGSNALQRFKIPLVHHSGKKLTIQFGFKPDKDLIDQQIIFATNIRNVCFGGYIFSFGLIGLILIVVQQYRCGWKGISTLAIFCIMALLILFVHWGMIVSNEFITDAGSSIKSITPRACQLLGGGDIQSRMYRGVGYVGIPSLMIAIENVSSTSEAKYFIEFYPTARYLMMIFFTAGLFYLLAAAKKHFSYGFSILLGFFMVIFYPFIIDLYTIPDDAYAIPLMLWMLGLILNDIFGTTKTLKYRVGMAFCLFLMTLTKVTPIYLAVIIPASFWFQSIIGKRCYMDWRSFGLLIVMVFIAMSGRFCAKLYQNDVIPGEPYAKSVIWEMVWAGYGLFDHHSAHWFTKSGGLRNKRVAERTGLPVEVSHIKHTQRANDEVYRPDVINAFKERPGFFYSTALLRFQKHGATFFRYTYGAGKPWQKWLEDGFRKDKIVSGKKVNGLTETRRSIRYGKKWKIANIVLLTNLVQGEFTLLFDMMLVLFSIVGIIFLRRWDIGIIFLGCLGAKFTFTVGLHGLVRYMNFNHVVMLFGLSYFLYICFKALYLVAQNESFKNSY